jgi:hypothetical protein
MNLEDELKSALRREEPPQGFADRVIAVAAAQPAEPARRWWSSPRWSSSPMTRWLAVAAVAGLIVMAGVGYRQWQGEMAKQKVMLALSIAGGEMHSTQLRVRHVLAERPGAVSGAEMENR